MAFNQQQLEKDGIYEATAPIPGLLTDLDQIARIAAIESIQRRKRSRLGWFVMLGGLVGFMIGVKIFTPLAILGALDLFVGLGIVISAAFIGGKITGNPTRVNFARRRLLTIQEDAGNKSPFALKLSLASRPQPPTKGPLAGRSTGTQQFTEENWYTLQGPLLDGSVLSDEVVDLARIRIKRNPRGKTKRKFRSRQQVTLRFAYPKELYGDARPAGQALENEPKSVHGGSNVRSVRVTEKSIILKALADGNTDPAGTAEMLSMTAYRILNLARRSAAQRGNTK